MASDVFLFWSNDYNFSIVCLYLRSEIDEITFISCYKVNKMINIEFEMQS